MATGGNGGTETMVPVVGDGRTLESAAGDDFVALYDRSVTDVYSYLYSRLRNRELAEDLTQDVFLAGARRAADGTPVEVPWLIAVARNKLVDHWRSLSRRERRLRLIRSDAEAEDEPLDALDGTRAAEALEALNASYRLALVLRHVDGLSVPQVAEHLGRTVAATEQILSRARAAFRKEYGESHA
jgi:RNA polymerase sigma-70 factor (ECF subfamily)